jgi:hypothetical protein
MCSVVLHTVVMSCKFGITGWERTHMFPLTSMDPGMSSQMTRCRKQLLACLASVFSCVLRDILTAAVGGGGGI